MQTFCDAIINLFPQEKISRRQSDGLIISDLLGNMAGAGLGEGTGVLPADFQQLNPTAVLPWAQNAYSLQMTGVEFARMFPDGRAQFGASSAGDNPDGELAGFFLSPRTAALDSQIGSNAGSITSGHTSFAWTGTAGRWTTAPALDPDGGTAILNVGSDAFSSARSIGPLPANRAFRVRLTLLGGAAPSSTGSSGAVSALPEVRLVWGDGYALRLSHGAAPRIERKTTKVVRQGNVAGQQETWSTVRVFEAAGRVNVRGGTYDIRILRLTGRLIVDIGGVAFWFLNTDIPASGGRGTTSEASWPAAPLVLEVANCRARCDVATLKWSSPTGTAFTGSLVRRVQTRVYLPPGATSTASCAGWKRAGTRASVAALYDGSGVTYTLSLAANADGIDTPFVSKVTARFKPVWVNPSPAPLDVRFACRRLSVSLGAPPNVAGSEATVELDQTELDRVAPGWKQYAGLWCPIEISLRRMGAAYSLCVSGYIFKAPISASASGARTVTLTVRDPIVRLQKVGEVFNALVDHRYLPLDLLFAEQIAAMTPAAQPADVGVLTGNGGYGTDGKPMSQTAGLYIGQAVKEILRIALGDSVAESLNGNGDPTKFLPQGWPPLLTSSNDVGGWMQMDAISGDAPPVAGGGWLFPPPFGDDVLSWINDLAKRDHCVFYFGWPPGYEGQAPVAIYGRQSEILRQSNTPLWTLKDVAVNGDYSRLMQNVNVEKRPERDLNRVVVWGKEEPSLAGLLPSMRIAEFNLPASSASAAWRSWERTLLVRDPAAFLGAESIGAGIIEQLSGVELQWPTFEIEGDERIGVGHLVTPSFTGDWADPALGLAGQWFRAEAVEHIVEFGETPGKFTTSIRPRPLSATEDAAFRSVIRI